MLGPVKSVESLRAAGLFERYGGNTPKEDRRPPRLRRRGEQRDAAGDHGADKPFKRGAAALAGCHNCQLCEIGARARCTAGIIYRALGFPTNMFTVMFALGRLPGWIAHWKEMLEDPSTKIGRPRQTYTGATETNYVPLEER